MKLLLAIIITIICMLLILRLFNSTQSTATDKIPELSDGLLLKCPNSPNCINSEYPEHKDHYLPPFNIPESANKQIMAQAETVLLEMGAYIITRSEHYLAATFSSRVFKFIDDFQLRLNDNGQLLHIRSASRTGYSDLGVNKQRVKHFLQLMNTHINSITINKAKSENE